MKDHRFGQLAATCLVGLHHFNDVIKFLDQIPDCRNQLACMIRGMADLEDFLKFSWAAAGLLGIHLYEPYLNLIIDCNTPHSELLRIFPEFYNKMLHPSLTFSQLESPALKSLTDGWRSPHSSDSPYDSDVINSLVHYIQTADVTLLDHHLEEVLSSFASGFADQKGEAYGFGPNGNDGEHTGHILNQGLSLEVLDKFLTHSKPVENAFGHLDQLLHQFGPQGFDKACQTIQISTSKDLVFDGSHQWKKMPVQK